MKTTIGKSHAAPMIVVALSTRMFWGLSLDISCAVNAAWMCPILGFLLYLPFAFAVSRADALGNASPIDNLKPHVPRGLFAAISALFALLLMWDGAAAVRLAASSSNAIALSDIPVPVLALPLSIVAGTVVLLGAQAEGNSARIWLKLVPLLLIIIFLVQFKSYNIGWLTPILGDGPSGIIDGCIYCAGAMALLSLPWLISVPDRNDRGVLRYVAFAALATSVMLVSEQMLCPVQLKSALTRSARMELVLSNGRLMLSPQLVVNVLWYGSLLHLISAQASVAAIYLKRIFPGASKWMLAVIVAIVLLILPGWDPVALRVYLRWIGMLFIIIGLALAALLKAAIPGKEKKA